MESTWAKMLRDLVEEIRALGKFEQDNALRAMREHCDELREAWLKEHLKDAPPIDPSNTYDLSKGD